MKEYDIAIIGAGAAGLAAAGAACIRGRRVVILDMGAVPARKVAISGGGRCNITNAAASRDRYFGKNPDFVRGALARVTPADILKWAATHNIKTTQKTPGQFFCSGSAADVVRALVQDAKNAELINNTTVTDVTYSDGKFIILFNSTNICAKSVIIATGGVSFPSCGVSDIGYKIAKQFGHKIVPVRPALCAINTNRFPAQWAGISVPVEITADKLCVHDDMLFTHCGIGGPAAYRISVVPPTARIQINLLPDCDVGLWLHEQKRITPRKSLASVLSTKMPSQIAKYFSGDISGNIADIKDSVLDKVASAITHIEIPAGAWRHHGMSAAEVTFGGVDTAQISSKTMESKLQPGLFFAGEVMDITGDLGGFNLHWAWTSGRVAGTNA